MSAIWGWHLNGSSTMSSDALPIPAHSQIYDLDTLWWGISVGGRHYTGNVRWTDKEGHYQCHELERKLSLREAKELDDTQLINWHGGYGRTTNRFDTEKQLERYAARWVEGEAKRSGFNHWLLIENDRHNPNRPIAAAGWYITRMTPMRELAKMWDKVPNGVRENNREVWDLVYDLWRQILTPPNEK